MTPRKPAVAGPAAKPDPKTLDEKALRGLVRTIERHGGRVSFAEPREQERHRLLEQWAKPGKVLRLGLVSDTHLGSKQQQLTALHDFYREADAAGVAAYIHAGDLVDGSPRMHRDALYGQFRHGFGAQLEYAERHYPKSQNGPTYVIDGNHDDSFYSSDGASPAKWLSRVRKDVRYLGYYSAVLEIGGLQIYVAHGAKGGAAYAASYKPQKLVEEMEASLRSDVDLIFFGHWHRYFDLGEYQGVEGVWSLPCFQSQTRFLRSIGKWPKVGGVILTVEFDRKGGVWDFSVRRRKYPVLRGDYPGAELDGEAA